MVPNELVGTLLGAVALGAIHGIEPGHGWPVAASYALDQTNKWIYGFAASSLLGIGHLVSSIAMVGAFFYAKAYFDLAQANEPITVLGDVQIGGPVSLVAGVLLIGLGIREYTHGHSHPHFGDAHDHDDHPHSHSHDRFGDAADSGLLGIAWFAFVLGFAHEEEFEIIAL
jgi:ABC-type nickel/cobalt efflux system permease component RcnA